MSWSILLQTETRLKNDRSISDNTPRFLGIKETQIADSATGEDEY
jgi:hypothetical protein